jgi:hypothetical protein
MIKVLGLLAVVGCTAPLLAAAVETLDVSHEGEVYYVTMIFSINAPVSEVRPVLTDYARLSALNPAIVESEVLAPPGRGITRVQTRLRDCIWFLCADIERVDDVTEARADGLNAPWCPRSAIWRPAILTYGSNLEARPRASSSRRTWNRVSGCRR